MIEKQTQEAVTSDEFVTVERSVVESVVKREKLNVKEVELFKAVDRWAIKESERQGITPESDWKRRILGEEIVKAIRFPLMSQKEFAFVVINADILTLKEVGDMMKHYVDGLTSYSPFLQVPRIGCARYRCHRFDKSCPPVNNIWGYRDSKRDSVQFSVSKPVTLFGIQHFGSEFGEYTVVTEVKDSADDSSIVKQSGSYASAKNKLEDNQYYGFDVQFDRPVCLQENKKYKLVSLIKGPSSWYGNAGRTSVECGGGVRFTFTSSDASSNVTSEIWGQFPAFIFA